MCTIYSGIPLLWTPWGPDEVSSIASTSEPCATFIFFKQCFYWCNTHKTVNSSRVCRRCTVSSAALASPILLSFALLWGLVQIHCALFTLLLGNLYTIYIVQGRKDYLGLVSCLPMELCSTSAMAASLLRPYYFFCLIVK